MDSDFKCEFCMWGRSCNICTKQGNYGKPCMGRLELRPVFCPLVESSEETKSEQKTEEPKPKINKLGELTYEEIISKKRSKFS